MDGVCVCVCPVRISDLQCLLRFYVWSTDHEGDPDVEFVQLSLIDGQRELPWEDKQSTVSGLADNESTKDGQIIFVREHI